MLPEFQGTPDDYFGEFVRQWFKLLAVGRIEEASRQLDEPNGYGIRWTPHEIQDAIELAFGEGCWFRKEHPGGLKLSDPDQALGTRYNYDVIELDDGSGFTGHYDVPLNGVWSDLTAQFEFLKRSGGYAVVLHDLHVL